MGIIYGYCRISRKKQNIERQARNIQKVFEDAHIIREVGTGTTTDGRREWSKLFNNVRAGDTIVFDSVSRMSRNAQEGFSTYQDLYEKNVSLIFLKEPHINTEVYKQTLNNRIPLIGDDIDLILDGVSKYLMKLAEKQIQLAFEQAEKEVNDLHQRVKEGIVTAKLNGKQIGRVTGQKVTTKKEVAAKEIIIKHSKSFDGTLTDGEVQKLAGISRNTYYKYKKQIMLMEVESLSEK